MRHQLIRLLIFTVLLTGCANISSSQGIVFKGTYPTGIPAGRAFVIVQLGQSNDSGKGQSTSLGSPYLGPQNARVFSTYGSGTNTRNNSTQTWQYLEYNKNHNNEGVNGVALNNVIGPEMSMMRDIAAVAPNQVFLIKVSYSSSTALGQGSSNDWKIGGPGTNYDNLVTNSLIYALNRIQSEFGLIPDLRLIKQMQGEAERDGCCGYTDVQLQAAYKKESYRLIQCLLDDLADAGYDFHNVSISWGRIHNNFQSPPFPAMVTAVRAAQVDIATNFLTDNPGYSRYVVSTTYLNTDSYPLEADFIHWNMTGQLQHGSDGALVITPTMASNRIIYDANTSGYDSDAAAFVIAAGITNQTHADAINTFVLAAKAHGYWSKIYAFWPMIGGNRRSHKLNIKNTAQFPLTYNRGFNHNKDGYWGDGLIGVAETGIPYSDLGQNTAGMFFYTPASIQEARIPNGISSVSNTCRFYLTPYWTDGKIYVANMGAETSFTATGTDRFFAMTRTSSTNYNVFHESTKVAVTSTSVTPDNTLIPLSARRASGTLGAFSTRVYQGFGLFNTSVTDTEMGNLRTDLAALNAAVR